MIHIPILRHGQPYESVETVEILHHATGEPLARVSQANSGLIARDIHRIDDTVLERFSVVELIGMCRKAAELFMTAALPLGDGSQSFDDYLGQLSGTTGMPIAYCGANAEKIHRVLAEMDVIVAGLTRGFDLSILDRGYGTNPAPYTPARAAGANGTQQSDKENLCAPPEPRALARATAPKSQTLSFFREGRTFGAVLPSNSPGVHGLWIPAVAMKAPVMLKPGREEPWTPYRIIQALIAAGMPREAFGFYPTDHAGAGELLRGVDRAMLFGGSETTQPWRSDPRVEIHGPGFSKIILGDDKADEFEKHLDLMVASIAGNCGRSCINASAVWTPRNGRAIAVALAKRLAKVEALPADDSSASIAAFANPKMAEAMSSVIDNDLRADGAIDLTEQYRGSSRAVTKGRVSYLLPTIIWCENREHPLANREFLFPFASVVECPTADMPKAVGPSLVVSAITRDETLIRSLMTASNVDRLNIGAIPTYQLSWDQPHEGNLFEHLYRQRALQIEPAA